eukprot:12881072-Alexandrium_andersonii.AAC.1
MVPLRRQPPSSATSGLLCPRRSRTLLLRMLSLGSYARGDDWRAQAPSSPCCSIFVTWGLL